MNSTESIIYTANEELKEITDKDNNTIEVIGYVETLIAPAEVWKGDKKFNLFKVILSNGSSKVTLLIWDSLIKKYEKELTMNRIIHIEKAVSKLTNAGYIKDKNMIPYELIINSGTTVEYLGTHNQSYEQENVVRKRVDFLGTVGVTGPVVIQGYLKTIFSLITHRNGTMSWGSGAITDGIFKINVQIATFVSSDIKKGTKIELTGEIKSLDHPITIHCTNMSNIKVLENEEPMPKDKLIHGVRTPRRPLVEENCSEEIKIISDCTKKFAFDNSKASMETENEI